LNKLGLVVHFEIFIFVILEIIEFFEGDFLVDVLYFKVNTVLFFKGVIDLVDDTLLDFVFDSVKTDNLSCHQIMRLFFGFNGIFDNLDLTLLEFS